MLAQGALRSIGAPARCMSRRRNRWSIAPCLLFCAPAWTPRFRSVRVGRDWNILNRPNIAFNVVSCLDTAVITLRSVVDPDTHLRARSYSKQNQRAKNWLLFFFLKELLLSQDCHHYIYAVKLSLRRYQTFLRSVFNKQTILRVRTLLQIYLVC